MVGRTEFFSALARKEPSLQFVEREQQGAGKAKLDLGLKLAGRMLESKCPVRTRRQARLLHACSESN